MRAPMKNLKRWLVWLILALPIAHAAPVLVYVGTYSQAGSKGIYALHFDPATGVFSEPFLAGEATDSSFLAFDPARRHLYAVDESGGTVGAYAIEAETGRLKFLNRRSTGSTAAHLVVDPSGRMLIVANYDGGTVSAFPLAADGRIGARSALVEQRGPPGPNHLRQSQSHPHSVTLSPDGRFALVCDLGLDRIFVYRLDPAHGRLIRQRPAFATVPPGSGPRHSVFSPDARYFYVVDEMGGSVCGFAYDAAKASLSLRQTISTLPVGFSGLNGSAEIQIHPNGRWIYASNRNVNGVGVGSDSLAVFARDSADGSLSLVEIDGCGGRIPRNFALSPDGGWLLCAHEESDDISVFHVDPATGRLASTAARASVSRPACVLFYK
jgi:6-phosphogluconolactonase